MKMKRTTSKEIALCGVLAALALTVMILGGMFPAASYCCPVLACILLVPVVETCGRRIAWAWYGAVALLSCLLCPDPEAAALFLFLGYLPRAALGVVWQFVYWIIILLLWPISGFAMVLTGLWLPAVLTMQAIYPVLNKAFDLERQIKAIRDAELDSSSDSDN